MKIGFCMFLWTTSLGKQREALLKKHKATGYDGWLTIGSFGRGLKDPAAATKVWRDFARIPEAVCRGGSRHIRDGRNKAEAAGRVMTA